LDYAPPDEEEATLAVAHVVDDRPFGHGDDRAARQERVAELTAEDRRQGGGRRRAMQFGRGRDFDHVDSLKMAIIRRPAFSPGNRSNVTTVTDLLHVSELQVLGKFVDLARPPDLTNFWRARC